MRLERFDVISFSVGHFSLSAHVLDKKENKELMLVTIYGPAQEDKKDQFLTELAQICSNKKYPMLLGGDFNILRFSSEKISLSTTINILTFLTLSLTLLS